MKQRLSLIIQWLMTVVALGHSKFFKKSDMKNLEIFTRRRENDFSNLYSSLKETILLLFTYSVCDEKLKITFPLFEKNTRHF